MNKTWHDIAETFRMELASLYPPDESMQLFLLAVEHLSGRAGRQYSLFKNEIVSSSDAETLTGILQQLQTARPIQHILGYAHFYGSTFEVSEHTLVPRAETEELVHLIINDHKSTQTPLQCIDIGTGTGCIPISLARHMPHHQYTAVDISHGALQVARQNAAKHHVNIQFMEVDILEWDLVFPEELRFDIIVSNPPYITPKERQDMHPNVLNFEPHTALFVEESAPLLFYDYIADFAKAHLNKGGHLYVEINQYLAAETAGLFTKKGFKEVQVYKDIHGADRMIRATDMIQ